MQTTQVQYGQEVKSMLQKRFWILSAQFGRFDPGWRMEVHNLHKLLWRQYQNFALLGCYTV